MESIQNDNILKLWGKADTDEKDNIVWHPLAYHMLDVAAVADVWLTTQSLLDNVTSPEHLIVICQLGRTQCHVSYRKDLINQVLTVRYMTQLVKDLSCRKLYARRETFRG